MLHPIRLAGLLAIAVLSVCSCEKEPVVKPPADAMFEVYVENDFNELQATYAVFLTDGDGKLRAFRWLPGSDTARVQVPGVRTTDRLDCTVVKLVTFEAQGSGVTDTSLTIRTYTRLASGESIHLRTLNYQQAIDLRVTFTNLTSLDTIIVPDGLAFIRPQQNNNFSGVYRVLHTGNMWLRLKVNGEPNWRYLSFNNLAGTALDVTADVMLLPVMLAPPKIITMPFTAPWQYNVEGVVDTASRQLFALGDLLRAPGGAIPVFGELQVYEPKVQIYNGYRIAATGTSNVPGGYTYSSDGFYASIPGSLPEPAFDLQPTTAASDRFVAVKCLGSFDLLVLGRARSGNPSIRWEVLTRPTNGIVTYRLPDVPAELGQRFFALKNYDFGNTVVARAENYERLDYEAVIRQLLRNDDPLWRAKAGYLGREEVQ